MGRIGFVRYTYQKLERRIGPLKVEEAEAMAKEFSRKSGMSGVVLEWWECTEQKEMP